MTRLDEELAAAAGAAEAAPNSQPPPVVAPARLERPKPKRNLALLIGCLVIAIGVVALAMSFQEAAVYAKTVDQLMSDKARLAGRPVRVEGQLVKGSLVHQEQPCEYRFRMQNAGAEVPVRYANCVVPDTFRDVPGMDVKVTVEGKLGSDGLLEATQVMAKCPSKYEMKERSEKGEQAPHTSM
jgi:cytochrome c-type biogenesis protein CcmE